MKRSRKKRHPPPKNPTKAKTRILIIDSDRVVADLLRAYLEGEKKFAVLAAESGVDGIRMAVENVPDLILLDFRLGDMGGLEVHERLRQNAATKEIPIIYVSSFITLRTIEQATLKGAKGFISKPFTLSEIYNKVATVLSST
ncbi:MAG: response regulator [Candidatus Hydrogenedentota bacterium]|nr:MAG: response regulator [Candidatus Hydrogenedentota bacterium]